MSNIPNNSGSVGSDMSKGKPGIISDSCSESGVKKTTRNNKVSKAKIASMMMTNAIGNALIIIECLFTKKNAFSKINSAEIR